MSINKKNKSSGNVFLFYTVENTFQTIRRRHVHLFLTTPPRQSVLSLTFAHPVSVSLKLTVLHARNDVKQGKNLLLGKRSPCWHHQAPCEFTRAEVHHLVVARIRCGRETRFNNRTDETAEINSQRGFMSGGVYASSLNKCSSQMSLSCPHYAL